MILSLDVQSFFFGCSRHRVPCILFRIELNGFASISFSSTMFSKQSKTHSPVGTYEKKHSIACDEFVRRETFLLNLDKSEFSRDEKRNENENVEILTKILKTLFFSKFYWIQLLTRKE